MYDIQSLNRKYNTLESILTVKGKLNTAIVRREFFKELDIFKEIAISTKELDVFGNVDFKDRVAYLRDGKKIETCPVCGKGYLKMEGSQKTYRLCNHKFDADRDKLSKSRMELNARRRKELEESLENEKPMTDDASFSERLEKTFRAPANWRFPITEESLPFLHDLVIRTSGAIPFDSGNPRFSERTFLLHEGLEGVPKCEYCDKPVSFRGRFLGYSTVCSEHMSDLGSRRKAENSLDRLTQSIDREKYEITRLPKNLQTDFLEITCRKCGKKSEWSVRNGMLGKIREKRLCRFCERSHSEAEEELYLAIKGFCGSEVVYKNGSRKTIPPYELDIYVPERKIAVEFDGLYWHGEANGGKGRGYHLEKTEMCEKKGIRLVHVFENEWNDKREIVLSRLKNLFGKYDSVVYARKCEIREVDNPTARAFLDENHLQGACNSPTRVGLFENGSMVSLMTFSKPRFRKDGTEWELVRFCSRLGCHVPGGASKLLKWFERKYRPKSVVSYADRRWSDGKLYSALGFRLAGKSKPNYWYVGKDRHTLFNRVCFQKHRLAKLLERFDEKLSERENMRNNGYDRIFDCGNLVFVKTYGDSGTEIPRKEEN